MNRLVLITLFFALASAPALAEKKPNREREAVRRVQMQLQQVQGQIAALEEEKTKLGDEREQARKEAKAVKGKVGKLDKALSEEKARGEQLQKDLEAAKQEQAATKASLLESETRLAETAKNLLQTQQTLARTEADKRQLEVLKVRQEKEIAGSEAKNLKLYQTGRELMTRFEQKSCAETLAQKEPFTGLKRVEIENLLEEYRDKLDEQKLIKPPG